MFAAKTYKRATRKEKIGLAASSAATMAASRPIQRHAPISATMSNTRGRLLDDRDGSALSQAANKLLLEAEKRAQQQQQDDEGDDVGMEDATATATTAPKAGKRKSGAGGMKQKASRKSAMTTTDTNTTTTGKKDYVDMLWVFLHFRMRCDDADLTPNYSEGRRKR